MYDVKTAKRPWPLFIMAALVCALFAGRIAAQGKPVTVSIQVSTEGLDLRKPADASAAYRRLKLAAREVCTWTGEYSGKTIARLGDFRACRILIPNVVCHCDARFCQPDDSPPY